PPFVLAHGIARALELLGGNPGRTGAQLRRRDRGGHARRSGRAPRILAAGGPPRFRRELSLGGRPIHGGTVTGGEIDDAHVAGAGGHPWKLRSPALAERARGRGRGLAVPERAHHASFEPRPLRGFR